MKVKVKKEATISFSKDEVQRLLIKAAPARFTCWFFYVQVNADGSAVLTATPDCKASED